MPEPSLKSARTPKLKLLQPNNSVKKGNTNKIVLVIGGGAGGLMTAWILVDKGYRVFLVAKGVEGERMTFQIARALWEYPPGGCGLSEIEVPVLADSALTRYRVWAMQRFLFYEHLTKSTDCGSSELEWSRRARESAKDHFQKTKKREAIFDLDAGKEVEHFKDKLAVALHDIPLGEAPRSETGKALDKDDEKYMEWRKWEDALGTNRPSPHDFKLKRGCRHQAPVVDTDFAMEFLMELVKAKGEILETRESKEDLHLQERELKDDFKADIIVNASSLGARVLANDNQVLPICGAPSSSSINPPPTTTPQADPPSTSPPPSNPQTNSQADFQAKAQVASESIEFLTSNATLLPAQYNANYHTPSKTIFIVPRNETTLIVGSIIQRNNWDLSFTLKSPEVEDTWGAPRSSSQHSRISNKTKRLLPRLATLLPLQCTGVGW
ncbi:FAD dependent oxidoreductase [Triangularia setosa]|uniref:FAD dependent oxidoreductase n=1 Tax=Triangularia setosa TaxID=2587417 RepID=A0AAN6WJU7_9PEZI|nr:FAD dependent oxidoreductase [Podospora setosa]